MDKQDREKLIKKAVPVAPGALAYVADRCAIVQEEREGKDDNIICVFAGGWPQKGLGLW